MRYVYVAMTSDTDRFIGFCINSTFSKPTLSTEPMFMISMMPTVGMIAGIST